MDRRRSPLVLAPLLALAGCGGNAYYATRGMPTSAAEAYAAPARWTLPEEREIYELPANPPAIDRDHTGVKNRQPGQILPAQVMVGMADEPWSGVPTVESNRLARMDDVQGPPPLRPLKSLAEVSGWQQEQVPGAREPLGVPRVGTYQDAPASQPASGLDRIPPIVTGATGETDVWSGVGVPPTSPVK
jgi:hypothetical protein